MRRTSAELCLLECEQVRDFPGGRPIQSVRTTRLRKQTQTRMPPSPETHARSKRYGNPMLHTLHMFSDALFSRVALATTPYLLEGLVRRIYRRGGIAKMPASALESSRFHKLGNHHKHTRAGLLPLILQLAVALDSIVGACAFIGQLSTRQPCEKAGGDPRQRVACRAEAASVTSTDSSELCKEKLYGFWVPAKKGGGTSSNPVDVSPPSRSLSWVQRWISEVDHSALALDYPSGGAFSLFGVQFVLYVQLQPCSSWCS